jgi:hypothetical protein
VLTEGISPAVRVSDDRWSAFVSPADLALQLVLFAMGVFLCVRRATGAIESPLPVLPLIATAAGLLAWAVALRGLTRTSHANWLPTVITVLFAIACSFPGNRIVDWLVWLPVLALDRWLQSRLAAVTPARVSAGDTGLQAEQQIQQITRFRATDGSEAIRGTLVAELAAGERSTTVYAAFCPPIEHLPVVQANLAGDSAATVKVAQLLHNGAQFDVRLSQPATGKRYVTIEFVADATNSE